LKREDLVRLKDTISQCQRQEVGERGTQGSGKHVHWGDVRNLNRFVTCVCVREIPSSSRRPASDNTKIPFNPGHFPRLPYLNILSDKPGTGSKDRLRGNPNQTANPYFISQLIWKPQLFALFWCKLLVIYYDYKNQGFTRISIINIKQNK
jgi:hypothetical protein